jgi:hypothetical protein
MRSNNAINGAAAVQSSAAAGERRPLVLIYGDLSINEHRPPYLWPDSLR